jgi:hypothetical protein
VDHCLRVRVSITLPPPAFLARLVMVGSGPVVEGGEKAAERVVKFLQGEDVKF